MWEWEALMLSLVQLSLLYVDHILFHCYSNSFALLYMCMGGGMILCLVKFPPSL